MDGGGGIQGYFRLARGRVSSLIVRYILKGVHWLRWLKHLNGRVQTI